MMLYRIRRLLGPKECYSVSRVFKILLAWGRPDLEGNRCGVFVLPGDTGGAVGSREVFAQELQPIRGFFGFLIQYQ